MNIRNLPNDIFEILRIVIQPGLNRASDDDFKGFQRIESEESTKYEPHLAEEIKEICRYAKEYQVLKLRKNHNPAPDKQELEEIQDKINAINEWLALGSNEIKNSIKIRML